MEEVKQIICTLIIPEKYYLELKNEIKEIFSKEKKSYKTQFPADAEESTFLGEYIQAFCEVVLIEGNPKYGITEDTLIETELFKLGDSEKNYCILIDIKSSESKKIANDILYFTEVSQNLGNYTFELLGDQTMFLD